MSLFTKFLGLDGTKLLDGINEWFRTNAAPVESAVLNEATTAISPIVDRTASAVASHLGVLHNIPQEDLALASFLATTSVKGELASALPAVLGSEPASANPTGQHGS